MNLKYFLILFLSLGNINLIFAKKWTDSVVDEILKVDASQVTIVTNQTKVTDEFGLVKEVSKTIPSVSVNLQDIALMSDNTSLPSRIFLR